MLPKGFFRHMVFGPRPHEYVQEDRPKMLVEASEWLRWAQEHGEPCPYITQAQEALRMALNA